jgi:hypothetical protein
MTPEGERRVPTAGGSLTVAELHRRCSVVEPGIVLMREIPGGTAQALRVMSERVRELGRPFGAFAVVVDLTEVDMRPKGDYLVAIRESVVEPAHTALTQPGSAFMRGVLRFVMGFLSNKASVHATIDEAVARARAALAAQRPTP